MKLAVSLLALVVIGCGVGFEEGDGVTPPPPPPPPPPPAACGVELRVDPPLPVAGPTTVIRVSASVEGLVLTNPLDWAISLDTTPVAFMYATDEDREIEFLAPTPGVYQVRLDLEGLNLPCSSVTRDINVRAPGAKVSRVRLRVVPPPGVAAPPFERALTVDDGANADLGSVVIDRGREVDVQVTGPNGGVPAYLRFSPDSAPDAVIEAFADSAGRVQPTLADEDHTVLVVPAGAGAPRQITGWHAFAPTDLVVTMGSTIAGTVTDPSNAVLAGAAVRLSIDGVPSTVATTDAAGRFSLQAVTGGRDVTVTVTPPESSGLPRLAATAAFDLGQLLQIRYAVNLGRRNLAGLQVRRGGSGLAGAKLMVVGSFPAVGTVTAGTGTPVTASGEVRIGVAADGTGTLPAKLVPAAQLIAVIDAGPRDLAAVALDTTASRPAQLEAPAPQVVATSVRTFDGVPLAGAVLDVVPIGALAMAAASPIHVIAGADGAFTTTLASGGHYELRFASPAGQAGPLVVADRIATTIDPAGYALPKALTIRGGLLRADSSPLANASVQILCGSCTGLERAKPIAEGVSDEDGRFTLAVADPGTM